MTKDDLARAVVGLPGFAWVLGVSLDDGQRLVSQPPNGHWIWLSQDGETTEINTIHLSNLGVRRLDLDDAATGGVLLAMVPPEHRHRVRWEPPSGSVPGYWAWACDVLAGQVMWAMADSLGHAAALVLVDCGWCHGG